MTGARTESGPGLLRGLGTPLMLVAVVALALLATWPTLASLVRYWVEIHEYEHGFLIVLIGAVWLFLVGRQMARAPLRPSLAGTGALTALLLLWLVAYNANSLIGQQLLWPPLVWLAICSVAGWDIGRRCLAPVAFLYFAVPVWDFAVPVLQRMSVAATEGILGLIGVPADVHEYLVTIPEGTFQIVEGCSGKRYFMVTLAVAVLAVAINHMRGWRAAGFVAAAAGLSLVANWLRIVVVIYAGHATNMQHYLVAEEHKTFGNAVFVVLLVVVFLLARWMTPAHGIGAGPSSRIQAGPAPGYAAATGRWQPWGAVLPVLMLAAVFGLVRAGASAAPSSPPMLAPLPLSVGIWQGPFPPATAWMPQFPGAAAERRAAYVARGGTVELYVNVYGEQRQGTELVSYGNTLLARGGWTRAWPNETEVLESPAAPDLAAFEATDADGSTWLLAWTYRVGIFMTTPEAMAQLAYGFQAILQPVPAGVVALASRCQTNCEAARALVGSFWGDMSGAVLAMLPDRLAGRPGTMSPAPDNQVGRE